MKLKEPSEIEAARQARRSAGLVRQRLLKPTPGVLETCAPHLRTAISSLECLQRSLLSSEHSPASRWTLKQEVAALRIELVQINALMKNAAAFYSGLATLLLPQPDDSIAYNPAGAVPLRAVPTLQIDA